MFSIKKRVLIRIASYVLSLIAVLSGFLYKNWYDAQTYQRYVEQEYQHAFSELVNSMTEIDSSLQKCVYASSPTLMTSICTEVFGRVMSAQMSLGMLPLSELHLDKTSSFVSKVGDYMYALSKKSASGQSFTEEESNNMKALSQTAALLSADLTSIQQQLQDGNLNFGDIGNATIEMSQDENLDVALQSLSGNLQTLEKEFPEVPTLIYDGPFSESIANREAQLLKDKQEVTQEEGLKLASEFLDMDASSLSYAASNEGQIKSYSYSCNSDGCEKYVEVTRQGGMVLSLINNRAVDEQKLNVEQAIAIAQDFLSSRGYSSMKESYWIVNNNVITINYAYMQDDVICYSDLVKVAIALDNGELAGFDAEGYIMNHVSRVISAATVTQEDAKAKVSKELKILSHSMTVIPTAGKNEVFCHEFKCETEDARHYLIYVNATTGVTEKILILLEDENGTLAM